MARKIHANFSPIAHDKIQLVSPIISGKGLTTPITLFHNTGRVQQARMDIETYTHSNIRKTDYSAIDFEV